MELCCVSTRLKGYAVALWLHTDVDPPKQEWDAALDRLIAELSSVAVADMRHLVISDGGAPSAPQRVRMTKEVARGQPMRLSVVTNVLSHPIKRGIATALSWVNPQVRFYQAHQAREALAHVDLGDEVDAVWASYTSMQQKLKRVQILDEVATALGH